MRIPLPISSVFPNLVDPVSDLICFLLHSSLSFMQRPFSSSEILIYISGVACDLTQSCSCLSGWEPSPWCRHRYRSGGGSLLAVTGSWKWPTARWKRIIYLVQTWASAAYQQTIIEIKTADLVHLHFLWAWCYDSWKEECCCTHYWDT